MISFVKRFCNLIVLTTSMTAAFSAPGDDDRIRVQNITPVLKDQVLTVSAEFENLFSDRITGTIQSGLPSIIQIEIKLLDSGKKTIARKLIAETITYDIWEERYHIETSDSTIILLTFDEVMRKASVLAGEPLAPRSQLHENDRFSIDIRVGIVPISTRQAEKVTDWLLDPNQTEEYIASDNRSSTFGVNLNKLVSFFVSSRKKSIYTSQWHSSPAFRISDLER